MITELELLTFLPDENLKMPHSVSFRFSLKNQKKFQGFVTSLPLVVENASPPGNLPPL